MAEKSYLEEVIGCGDTILLAQENACKLLGVKKSDVDFEVVQLSEKKFLGIFGGKPAKVIARLKDKALYYAMSYLDSIFKNLSNKDILIEPKEIESGVVFNLSGDGVEDLLNSGIDVIDSILYLTELSASQKKGSFYRIKIHIDGLEQKRKQVLEEIAVNTIKKVRYNKRNVALKNMNSYQRKLIHSFVQKQKDIVSWSEGTGRDRHVVIGLSRK